MKLLKTLLFAILLLCLTATALAGNTRPGIENEMPVEIREYFAADRFADAVIMDYQIIGSYCFTAVRTGERTNTLYAFRLKDDSWHYWMKNAGALPQGGYDIWLDDVTGQEYYFGRDGVRVFTLPTLRICRLDEDNMGESADRWIYYSLRNGAWQIENFHIPFDTQVLFDDNELIYYGGMDAFYLQGSVRATVQRDIRYISLDNIPLDYHAAKDKLTVAPYLPASAELAAQNIKFTGSRKYDVYSAPTHASYRPANGKAVVSTNSWIQVFGVEDGWAMIQYSIDAEHYRIGYIVEEALPAAADVGYLNFSPVPAWPDRLVTLTDDPFYSGEAITTIGFGTQVEWLATIGSWAYVEIDNGRLMRGFVPANALYTDYQLLWQANTTPVPAAMTTPIPGADK